MKHATQVYSMASHVDSHSCQASGFLCLSSDIVAIVLAQNAHVDSTISALTPRLMIVPKPFIGTPFAPKRENPAAGERASQRPEAELALDSQSQAGLAEAAFEEVGLQLASSNR